MNDSPVHLQSGEVLASDGKSFWVLNVQTGKIVKRWAPGEKPPDFGVRSDAILLEKLRAMESDYDWTDGFSDRDLYEKILQTHAARSHLDFSLEQTPVLPHTAYKRVNLIPREKPARILLVGDDDLLSIPLALLGHQVTALEIDPYTLKTIEHFKALWKLPNIELLPQDLTKPLDPRLQDQFDYCFTDPLSTYNCLVVFMSRAISCLKPNAELFVALSDAGDAIGAHLAQRMQLQFEKKYRGLNHYYTVMFAVCHYTSHLLRYRKTVETRPLLAANAAFTDDLFSFANSFDYHFIEDFYDCAVFEKHSAAEVIALVQQVIQQVSGTMSQRIMPASELGKMVFILWGHKSMRLRLDEQRRWVGVDALPLDRLEALMLNRDLKRVLGSKRSVSRVAERNPGRP